MISVMLIGPYAVAETRLAEYARHLRAASVGLVGENSDPVAERISLRSDRLMRSYGRAPVQNAAAAELRP